MPIDPEVAITDQVAALPYRFDSNGNIEVLLVTSRSSKDHWIPPKGHLMVGKAPYEAAAQEAYEEAGIIGGIARRPIGIYRAIKIAPSGTTDKLNVTVFPMRFVKRAPDWPEKGQRATLWFEPGDAVRAVREPELASLIARFRPAQAA